MNKEPVIRIATRRSPLAIRQANMVAEQLKALNTRIKIVLMPIVTTGDKLYQKPLYNIGGKNLFIKELEIALLNDKADIAVHSMKDLPTVLPPKLQISAICKRENPQDAFISNTISNIDMLNKNNTIGTSSLRRQSQLKFYNNNVKIHFLRGNIGTRLRHLDEGNFDGIILAAAGLIRMGYKSKITQYLPLDCFIPACGQGAIGVESLSSNTSLNELLKGLHHEQTSICVQAERMLVNALNGNCQTPIASYAYIEKKELRLRGMVAMPDGSKVIKTNVVGCYRHFKNIAEEATENLKKQGAEAILSKLKA